MTGTPPMPAGGRFPDEDEEPQVLHDSSSKGESNLRHQDHSRSTDPRRERGRSRARSLSRRSSHREERNSSPQSNSRYSKHILYEEAKRLFNMNDIWRMKDGTKLWCRPTFSLPDQFHWDDVNLAKFPCKRCEKINSTKPKEDLPIPCLILTRLERCLLCFHEKMRHEQCCAREVNEQRYKNDQRFSGHSSRSWNRYDQSYYGYNQDYDYGYDRRANQDHFHPPTSSRNYHSREEHDRDRGRRLERSNRANRSPSRRPSVARSMRDRSASIERSNRCDRGRSRRPCARERSASIERSERRDKRLRLHSNLAQSTRGSPAPIERSNGRNRSHSRRPSLALSRRERSVSISQDTVKAIVSPRVGKSQNARVDSPPTITAQNGTSRPENDTEMNIEEGHQSRLHARQVDAISLYTSSPTLSPAVDPIQAANVRINELKSKISLLTKESARQVLEIQELRQKNDRSEKLLKESDQEYSQIAKKNDGLEDLLKDLNQKYSELAKKSFEMERELKQFKQNKIKLTHLQQTLSDLSGIIHKSEQRQCQSHSN